MHEDRAPHAWGASRFVIRKSDNKTKTPSRTSYLGILRSAQDDAEMAYPLWGAAPAERVVGGFARLRLGMRGPLLPLVGEVPAQRGMGFENPSDA